MDLWVSFWSALTGFISEYGLMAVALIVMLRSAAVPIPVPADLLVVGVGVQAREQGTLLWPVWLLLSAATVIGALMFYAFVRWIGEGDATHYGRYVGLTPERLTVAEQRLEARGVRGVVVARIVPGLRLPIVAVCGMLGFEWWKVLVGVTLGALTYVGICIALGYAYGQGLVDGLDALVFPLGVVEPLLGLAILLFWFLRARSFTIPVSVDGESGGTSSLRLGVLCGGIATLGANWLLNVLLYVVTPIKTGSSLEATIQSAGGVETLAQAFLADVLLGVALGVVYVATAERVAHGWDNWLRGLLFGVLTGALVVLVHVFQGSSTGLSVHALIEAIRWLSYGVFIGLAYPLVSGQRCVA